MASGQCGGISTVVWCTYDNAEKWLWGLCQWLPGQNSVQCDQTNVQELKKCEKATLGQHGTIQRVQPNTKNFFKPAFKVPVLKWVVLAWHGYKTSGLAWGDDWITLGLFLAGYLNIISDTGDFCVISLVLYWADRRRSPGRSRAAAWRSSTWWP